MQQNEAPKDEKSLPTEAEIDEGFAQMAELPPEEIARRVKASGITPELIAKARAKLNERP